MFLTMIRFWTLLRHFFLFSIASPTDVVKKSVVPVSGDRKMQCQFGEKTLNLLDHVLYEGGDKLNCKCYIPPMVHCLKNAVV